MILDSGLNEAFYLCWYFASQRKSSTQSSSAHDLQHWQICDDSAGTMMIFWKVAESKMLRLTRWMTFLNQISIFIFFPIVAIWNSFKKCKAFFLKFSWITLPLIFDIPAPKTRPQMVAKLSIALYHIIPNIVCGLYIY